MEAKAIARSLGFQYPHPPSHLPFNIHNWACELHLVGIRANRLPQLPITRQTTYVVMAGLAGALDPRLTSGDIVVDAPPFLANSNLPFHLGNIHTSHTIVATTRHKAELFQQTGALAVDMENAIVKQAAEHAGVPFVGIRAICDTADQNIDPQILRLVDPLGRPRTAPLLATLLRKPQLLPHLWTLSLNAKKAASHLGQAVKTLAEQLWQVHSESPDQPRTTAHTNSTPPDPAHPPDPKPSQPPTTVL